MANLWQLFWTFARIGSVTFGGGYAMLPIIRREVVEAKQWTTDDRLSEYYAIGQCTPGIIAVNTATFIGFDLRGIIGGIIATLGMIFPSLVIIMLVAVFFERVHEYPLLQHAFAGIRIGVVALIVFAVTNMWRQSIGNRLQTVIFALSFVMIGVFNWSPVAVIVIAGTIGAVAAHAAGKDVTPS